MGTLAAEAGNADWTPFLQPAVVFTVGIIALLGGVYLERFKRRAADSRWLLEQRHDAYVAFIRAADDFDRQYLAADLSQSEEPAEAVAGLVQAWASVLLVGTTAAAADADKVVGEGNKVIGAFRARRNVSRERVPFVDAYIDMAIALRAEVQPEKSGWRSLLQRLVPSRHRASSAPSVAAQQASAAARRKEASSDPTAT